MPYDESSWRQAAQQHYLTAAQIDVPLAAQEALQLAARAEAESAGGLAGLADQVRAEINQRWPGRLKEPAREPPAPSRAPRRR